MRTRTGALAVALPLAAALLASACSSSSSSGTSNAASFISSLGAWTNALATFKSAHSGTPVATTEPVADYMLQAAGADNLTPWTFQADIMNGNDPSPQLVATQNSLFTQHKVKVFLYNKQVTSSTT